MIILYLYIKSLFFSPNRTALQTYTKKSFKILRCDYGTNKPQASSSVFHKGLWLDERLPQKMFFLKNIF